MKNLALPLFAALLAAVSLHAEQSFDISITESCMADALGFEERQYCVGAAARQCMEYLGDAEGLARCAADETTWWEARIESSLGRISEGSSVEQANTLKKMQAAWLAYRDESCRFEQVFSEGDGMNEAECLLWKTGDQAVFLEDYLPRN